MFFKPAKNLINIAIVFPPMFVFYHICNFGLKVPYWDQWDLVPLLEKLHNNTLGFADVWSMHNEHRTIFPKMLMLFSAYFSNWSIFLELCTSMVLASLSLFFLLSIFNNTSKYLKAPWMKTIISLMIFSMIQYENWYWGWQVQIFMSVLGTIIAIWSVNKEQGKATGLTIAILAAIISSYSFNAGLTTWPALGIILLLQKKWKLKHIIILSMAFITTVFVYYFGSNKLSNYPTISFLVHHPLVYIKYILTYLGSPLGQTVNSSIIMSLLVLVITALSSLDIWRFRKEEFRNLAPWLGIMTYVFLSACATGLGRAHFGLEQALSSRYATFSALFIICAAVIIWHSIKLNIEIRGKKSLKDVLFIIAIASVFFISYVKTYHVGIKEIKRRSKHINEAAFCLESPESANKEFLKRLYPVENIVRNRIKVLSEIGIKFKVDSKSEKEVK